MAYPPTPERIDRTPLTPAAGHAADHNNTSQHVNDSINELGNNPSGSFATVEARLSSSDTTLTSHIANTTAHGIANFANLIQTNDPRLSDARSPTGLAGGHLTGLFPNPNIANNVINVNHLVPAVYGSNISIQNPGDAVVPGTSLTVARSDHKHGLPAFGSPVTQNIGDAIFAGISPLLARVDHKHGFPTFGVPLASRPGDPGAAGVSVQLPRADHVHPREPYGLPVPIGNALSIGTLNEVSRSDHVHTVPRSWDVAWGEVAYVEKTSGMDGINSTIVDIPGLSVSWTAVANRKYLVTLFLPVLNQVGTAVGTIAISDGSNVRKAQCNSGQTNAGTYFVIVKERVVSQAPTMTRKARISTNAGTLSLVCLPDIRGFLLVEDIGPNGSPA